MKIKLNKDRQFYLGFAISMVGLVIFLVIRLYEVYEVSTRMFWLLNISSVIIFMIGVAWVILSVLNDKFLKKLFG